MKLKLTAADWVYFHPFTAPHPPELNLALTGLLELMWSNKTFEFSASEENENYLKPL